MALKTYIPVGQKLFSKKLNLKFYIIFTMISVKIRLACSQVLLLINYFERRF